MSQEFTVKLEGWDGLERNLQALQEDIAKKAVVNAARAGANVLKASFAASVAGTFKVQTGRLLRGIITSFKVYYHGLRGSTVWFRIGLRARPGKDAPWYGRLQEQGYHAIGRGKGRRYQHRRLLKKGGGLGKVYKKPFIAPAFESSYRQALDAMAASLRNFFDQRAGK